MQEIILNPQSSISFPLQVKPSLFEYYHKKRKKSVGACHIHSPYHYYIINWNTHSRFNSFTYEPHRVSFWVVIMVIYEDPVIEYCISSNPNHVTIILRPTGPDGHLGGLPVGRSHSQVPSECPRINLHK